MELKEGQRVTVNTPHMAGIHGKQGTVAIIPVHSLTYFGIRLDEPTEHMIGDTIALRDYEFEVNDER